MDGSKSCGSIARMSVTVVVPSMCRIKNSNFFLARITTIGSTKELTNNPLRNLLTDHLRSIENSSELVLVFHKVKNNNK